MEPNNTTPNPNPAPEVSGAVPNPVETTQPTPTVNESKKSGSFGGKKNLIMVLLLVVIVVILGALGYYYYAFVMNAPAEKVSAVPSVAPQVTQTPASEDQIKDSSELDGIVSELDNASEEASMNQESSSLQSDSSF